MFIRNRWYAAAWGTEVASGTEQVPLARRIAGVDVVIFRAGDGRVVALEDRCCHRNLPLSHGRIDGNNIRCGYHGLLFDRDGNCIEVPGQSAIPPGAAVEAYPALERWQWIWLWLGDPQIADPDLIPEYDFMDSPDWACAPGNGGKPLPIACHYELSNDNLLDLSHVVFVHQSSLASAGLTDFPVETERFEDRVQMTRWAYGIEPPPIFVEYCGITDPVDRWQSSVIISPAHCIVDVGVLPAGSGREARGNVPAPSLRVAISTTPETENTSLMFFCQTRNFEVRSEALTRKIQTDFLNVFMEDVSVLEAQQNVYDRRPDAPTVDINVDSPTIAMRAVNRRMLEAEAGV